LIVIGIAGFGGGARWEATRIWVPLNVPVSLSPGHIRTAEFKINVEGFYQIEIEVRRGFDYWGVPCLIGGDECEGNPGVLGVSWSLSSGGRAIANGASKGGDSTVKERATFGRVVGGFDAGEGVYVLDLDVLRDGSRLNGGAPRLVVFEAGYNPRAYANDIGDAIFLLSLLLAAAGTYLVIRPVLVRRWEMAALARNCSLTQRGPQARDLRIGRELPASPIVRTVFRPPASACVGAVLILAGLAAYASIQHANPDTGFTSLLLWLCLLSMGAGGILLVIGGVERFRKPLPPVAPCVREGTAGGHFRWKRRPVKARPLFPMSYFGLIALITYLLEFISIGVLQSSAYIIPVGLRIHLVRPGISARRNPGIQPLLVRVESGGRSWRASLYVDSRPVSWEDFGGVLQKELNQRPPDWPVYLQGDPDMDWQWAVRAMDTIRGLHAEVVLLTSAPALPRGQSGSRTRR
jgi:hypothetical protein